MYIITYILKEIYIYHDINMYVNIYIYIGVYSNVYSRQQTNS